MNGPVVALRRLTGHHLPVYVFVASFALTVVLGNVVFVLPDGTGGPILDHWRLRFRSFRHFNTPAFWALLGLALVMVPLVSFAVEPLFARLMVRAQAARTSIRARPALREIQPITYAAIALALHGFCLVTIERQSLLTILRSIGDATSSTEARYVILDRAGFTFRVAVNSLLPLFVVYALIRTLRGDGRFWTAACVVNLVLTSAYLLVLNMKWPVLVLWLLGALVFYAFGRRYVTLGLVVACVVVGVGYVGIAASVHRVGYVPVPSAAPSTIATPARPAGASRTLSAGLAIAHEIPTVLRLGLANAGTFLTLFVARMAAAYPFYVEEFTEKGQICGTVWDRIVRRTPPCSPSTYVYTLMSPGFHRYPGTAPASVTIYGYALGGWPVAVATSVLAGLVLGGFCAIGRLRDHPLAGAVWIMGSHVAYFMTQLPFEGAFVYDHGVLWWAFLLVAVGGVQTLASRLRRA